MKKTRTFSVFLFLAALAVQSLWCGFAYAQEVETPAIPITVTPKDRSVLIEWDHPDASLISGLVSEDSLWGGTATLAVSGDFEGQCDLDITFRAINSQEVFQNPRVENPIFQSENSDRPDYWTGSATPLAWGEPDICTDHYVQMTALSSDSITADGLASGTPLGFFWMDVPDTGTVWLPADFRPEEDSIYTSSGIYLSFTEGSVHEGEDFSLFANSFQIFLAWNYIPQGAPETERVSSSDPHEAPMIICKPDEWVDFRFGLSVGITIDTTYRDSTIVTIAEHDSIVEPGDTVTVYDTTITVETIAEIQGSVSSSGDTLGLMQYFWRKIDGYRIFRSEITHPDQYVLLREYIFCHDEDLDSLQLSPLRYVDREGVHNGFPYKYYVTAFDTLTHNESDSLGSGNVYPRSEATEDLSRIMVVPNPYKRHTGWEEESEKIQFTHLPERATIQVYTVGGDLVKEWEHYDSDVGGNSNWNTRNGNGDLVASGIYLFYVKSANGGERVGKFIIVR